MKLLLAFLLFIPLALGGCKTMPEPKNANGTLNPSVAIGEASLGYARLANQAQVYIEKCRAAPTSIGCSDANIAKVKAATVKADAAVKAALDGIKANPNAGASTIDGYIADINIALALLQALVPANGG
jgi:hypothetical protein